MSNNTQEILFKNNSPQKQIKNLSNYLKFEIHNNIKKSKVLADNFLTMFIIFDNKKVKKILFKLIRIYNKILYKIKLNFFLKLKNKILKKENKNNKISLINSKSENVFKKNFFINENHVKKNKNINNFLNYNKSFSNNNKNNIKKLFLNIDSNNKKNFTENKKIFNKNFNSFSSIFNTNSNNKFFNEFPITKSLKNSQIKKKPKKKENEIFDYLQLFFMNQIKKKKSIKNKFLNTSNKKKNKKNIFNIRNYSNYLNQEKNLDNYFSNMNKKHENKIKVQQIINKYKNIDNFFSENNKKNLQIKNIPIQKINAFSDSSKSTQLISRRSNNEIQDEIKKNNLKISNEINEQFFKNYENKITIQSFSDSKLFDYADKLLQKKESFNSY